MNLTKYMNQSIENLIGSALRNTLSNPKESAFLLRMVRLQKRASEKRQKKEDDGEHVPPFLIASIASQCNLHCAGCYARANHSCCDEAAIQELTVQDWSRIFSEAAAMGISFVLLAGGEPLFRKEVVESAAQIAELIFPIFTNGTMIDASYIQLFDRNRNLIPVLSMEGDEAQTDSRRGAGTYQILQNAMEQLKTNGIFFGASVTFTSENLEQVTDEGYLKVLEQKGCKLVFYVEYVPTAQGTEHLAPTEQNRLFLEEKLEKLRTQFQSIIFLSFPGDEKNLGGCLAGGRGFFHINARGGAEPCPFSPFSDLNLKNHSLSEAVQSPLFQGIRIHRLAEIPHTGGCALFANQQAVQKLMMREDV